jgi:hypothetical protein
MLLNVTLENELQWETVFKDDFENTDSNWEQTNKSMEQSFIKDAFYWMKNFETFGWKFYHLPMPKGLIKNFTISTQIELLKHPGYGQFGLVWGFKKPHSILNRFVVSTDKNRFTVVKFDKNHLKRYHRFSNDFKQDEKDKNIFHLELMLLEDYYYFFLQQNPIPVYVCHKAHLMLEGDRFGFYVEPGIQIRTSEITIQRISSNAQLGAIGLTTLGMFTKNKIKDVKNH